VAGGTAGAAGRVRGARVGAGSATRGSGGSLLSRPLTWAGIAVVALIAAFPWRRSAPPTVDQLLVELVGAGVGRFVLSHGGSQPDLEKVRSLVRSYDAEVLVAGGVRDLDGIRRLRDTGVAGVILGEALLSGAIDLTAALEAAA